MKEMQKSKIEDSRSRSHNQDCESTSDQRGKGAQGHIRSKSKMYEPIITEPFLEKPADHKKKILNQVKVYLITYLAYTVIHLEKEFWSFSKPYIVKKHPDLLSKEILSHFDTSQLFFYAMSLYVCGVLGDKYNQRYVLTIGFSGMTVLYLVLALIGFFDVTNQACFYIVLSGIGIFNATLQPCMISINGNWFPKKTRGFVVGLWATCNNFGNITGSQLAALILNLTNGQWQWTMVLAAAFALTFALTIFFFLPIHPSDVGIQIEELTKKEMLVATAMENKKVFDKVVSVDGRSKSVVENIAEVEKTREFNHIKQSSLSTAIIKGNITFLKAWLLPGVILYSSAFFCTKMAVYQLLLWLPSFLKQSDLAYNDQQVANLVNMLDFGAIFGSMTLGYLSDLTYGKRSPVAFLAVIFASLIAFSLKFFVLQMHTALLFTSVFMLGFFISGLNNLISSACAADLGKQESLKGNERATSTVTGIIDGTGTLGSAVGQYIIGVTQRKWGWYNGYLLVIAIDISATVIPILGLAFKEIKELYKIRQLQKALDI